MFQNRTGHTVVVSLVIVALLTAPFGGIAAADTDESFYQITDLDAPDTAGVGDEIFASATLTNTGDEGGDQPVTLEIHDDTGTSVQTLDVSYQKRDAGESTVVGHEGVVDVQPGTYTLVMESEDDAATQEFTVLSPAMFEVSDLNTATTVSEDGDIFVTADVANTGEVRDKQYVSFELLDADEEFIEELDFSYQHRSGGEAAYVSFLWDVDVDPGEYTIAIRSEDDVDSQPLTVTEAADPASFDLSDIEAPATVEQGEPFDVTVPVANSGDASATQTLTLEIEDENVSRSRTATLSAGEETTLTFEDVSVSEPGSHTIVAASDNTTATHELSVTGVADPALFDLRDPKAPREVPSGEQFSTEVAVSNIGDLDGTQNVTVAINHTATTAQQTVSLDAAETTVVTFDDLSVATPGEYTVTFATEDDSITREIAVTGSGDASSSDPDESSGSSSGSDNSVGVDKPAGVTTTAGVAVSATGASSGASGTTVRLGGTSMGSIAFDDAVRGTVSVAELDGTPPSSPNLGIDQPLLTAFHITVPDGHANSSAKLQIDLSAEQLTAFDGQAEEIVVYRDVGGEYESLNTTVVDKGSNGATLTAATTGFSVFAVTTENSISNDDTDSTETDAGSTDTAADGSATANTEPTTSTATAEPGERDVDDTGATPDSAEDQSGFGVIAGLLALLGAALLATRRL